MSAGRRDALAEEIGRYANEDMVRWSGFERSVLVETPEGLLNVAHWRSKTAYESYLGSPSSSRVRRVLSDAAEHVETEVHQVRAICDGPKDAENTEDRE